MAREKELTDFLTRMQDQYHIKPESHKRICSMLERICRDDFPADKFSWVLEQTELAYQRFAKQQERYAQMKEIQNKLEAENDPTKKLEYIQELTQIATHYAKASAESIAHAAELMKQAIETAKRKQLAKLN